MSEAQLSEERIRAIIREEMALALTESLKKATGPTSVANQRAAEPPPSASGQPTGGKASYSGMAKKGLPKLPRVETEAGVRVEAAGPSRVATTPGGKAPDRELPAKEGASGKRPRAKGRKVADAVKRSRQAAGDGASATRPPPTSSDALTSDGGDAFTTVARKKKKKKTKKRAVGGPDRKVGFLVTMGSAAAATVQTEVLSKVDPVQAGLGFRRVAPSREGLRMELSSKNPLKEAEFRKNLEEQGFTVTDLATARLPRMALHGVESKLDAAQILSAITSQNPKLVDDGLKGRSRSCTG
ncbi:hypothetical protein M8J76_000088 [Diaphorina citri]|nr:hypothetical protein M8J76_000088 [Diaphorina citri]